MGDDSLTKHHSKEFATLRGRARPRSRSRSTLMLGLSLIGFLFFLTIAFKDARVREIKTFNQDSPWMLELIGEQNQLQDWIQRRGTDLEVQIFSSFSRALIASARAIEGEVVAGNSVSILTSILLTIHSALLRISFLLIAGVRVVLAFMLIGFVSGLKTIKAYNEEDLLGATGNGQLFFSGVRASLGSTHESGAPNVLIPGLACPKKASDDVLDSSKLGHLLADLRIESETTRELAKIIVQHSTWPAFVSSSSDEKKIQETVVNINLETHAMLCLETAIRLHEKLPRTDYKIVARSNIQEETKANKALTLNEYTNNLSLLLERAFSNSFRQALLEISKEEVAALILSLEAAKVMTQVLEGDKWIRTSQFRHLSARAVLHSIPAFAKDFDFDARARIRRALVYAIRYNPFGLVRFPAEMDAPTRSLRQWAELLNASPHEIHSVADEVELFALTHEAHEAWLKSVTNLIANRDPRASRNIYTTQANLFLMPLKDIIAITKETLTPQHRERLANLTSVVSKNQALLDLSNEALVEEKPHGQPSARIVRPFSVDEIKRLAKLHNLSEDEIKEWSSLRVVLNAYTWLARRVGESTVPESSLSLVVLKTLDEMSGDTARNGKRGMIAFRGTRLKDRFGANWREYFNQVEAASIADTNEDFEKLLKGEIREDDEGFGIE